jgi:hypothetical protein
MLMMSRCELSPQKNQLSSNEPVDSVAPKYRFGWIDTTFGWFDHSSPRSRIGREQGRYCFVFTLFSYFFSHI